ncbi:hypothetical protein P389DRAFT_173889 [Cystobasidium minutum MCA 4210]|uniref:uncharacterized protein n=1 Tax=Cystobasidium minutum MCA 4210 TaxID=1397322 RepID=UPI0034CD7937|eukprot:jgi/Rhomi1/173889/fgenesh1_kg.6_\
MKALGRRLKPPASTSQAISHAIRRPATTAAPAAAQYQSTSSLEANVYSFSRHLAHKRAAAAFDEFRSLLQQAKSPETLEQCIHTFGRYKQYEHMKKAIAAYLDYGYMPSSELWEHLLQIAGLSSAPTTDISPYFKHGLLTAINDEESLFSLIKYTSRYGLIEVGEQLFLKYSERLKAESGSETAEPAPRFWAALIDGRAKVADLDEAFTWFMRWRTSPNHPCPTSEEVHEMVEGSRNYSKRLVSIVANRSAMREVFAPLDESFAGDDIQLKQDRPLPKQPQRQPAPAPYLALLRALSRRNDIPSQYLLELMAADNVPLKTVTMNGLIENEFKRQEKGQLASVLALYDKMRTHPDPAYHPDIVTFYHIFQIYREPRQVSSISNPPPQPTMLARKAELPPPPEEYLPNPRALYIDMCTTHARHRQSGSEAEFIDAQALTAAVGAFVRTRDFVGCAAAMTVFKLLRIEPTAQLHATVTFGLLRARTRREGFLQGGSEYHMTDEEAARLQRHINHLNDLIGYDKPIIVRGQKLDLSSSESHPQTSVWAIQSNISEITRKEKSFEMHTWNDRIVPRTDSELRSTQRYELRYLKPLNRLLRRASGLDETTWNGNVEALVDTYASILHRSNASSRHGR